MSEQIEYLLVKFQVISDCMSVAKDLLEIMACPKCKGDIKEKGMFILCKKCDLAYPVLDGDVPDMLIEDAWKIEKAEKSDFKHKLKL